MSKRKAIELSSDSECDDVIVYNEHGQEIIELMSDSEYSSSVTIVETHVAPSKKVNKKASGASSVKQEYPSPISVAHNMKPSASYDMKPSALPSEFILKPIEEANNEEKKEYDVFAEKLCNFVEQYDTAIAKYEQEEENVDDAKDYSRKLRKSADFFLKMYYPWNKLGNSGWGKCDVFNKHVDRLTKSSSGCGLQTVYLFAWIARDEYGKDHKFEFGLGTRTTAIYIDGFYRFRLEHGVN